jgi:hypothetical protein
MGPAGLAHRGYGSERILRQRLRGEIVAADAQVDFAIIKINGERAFPVLPLSDSDVLKVGELLRSSLVSRHAITKGRGLESAGTRA